MFDDGKIYKTLETHQLKERIKYNFCPACYKEAKKTYTEDKIKTDEGTLRTLLYKKILVSEKVNDEWRSYIEEYYYCARCKKNLTVDVFVNAYCKPYRTFEEKK